MKTEFIFESPMPFKQCHASTIIELPENRFFMACFGGTHEGNKDVGIWGSVRTKDGWQRPQLLAKLKDQPHWNPVLFMDQNQVIHLYFKVGNSCRHWKTWEIKSYDFCKSWTSPVELVPGNLYRGPVKNKCIILSNGTWLAPSSSEIGWWQAFVDRSEDQGKSWQKSKMVPMSREIAGRLEKKVAGVGEKGKEMRYAAIQPTLWESEPGHVHMLLRSSTKAICRSDSDDNGKTWSKVYKTSLPNNNSGIDLAKLKDGTLVLAYNPVASHWGERWPMTIAVSKNNGETWKKLMDTDSEPREYSYPAVIATADGGVAITYTWDRENIKFIKFDRDELLTSLEPI